MSRGAAATAPARRAASSGTAERFAARVRSRRRRRAASALAAVVVLVAVVWLALFSPWLTVEQVRIRGTERVPDGAVRAVVDAELGRPMVLLNPRSVARAVAKVPLIRTVEVSRRWPSTVVITVHERVPVAAVPPAAGGSGFRLVDTDGVEVESVSQRPASLPYLEVDVARPGPATLVAALDVLDSLPPTLRGRVSKIGATSPDGTWFTLSADPGSKGKAATRTAKVVWGSPDQADRKVVVLAALIRSAGPEGAAVYDVSAPGAPAVKPR
jgi:cell division protein FtsQ